MVDFFVVFFAKLVLLVMMQTVADDKTFSI